MAGFSKRMCQEIHGGLGDLQEGARSRQVLLVIGHGIPESVYRHENWAHHAREIHAQSFPYIECLLLSLAQIPNTDLGCSKRPMC